MSNHTRLPPVTAFMHAAQQHDLSAAPSSATGQLQPFPLYSSSRNDVTIVMRAWDSRGANSAPNSDHSMTHSSSSPGDARQERLQQAIASILAKDSAEKEPRGVARLANKQARGGDVAIAAASGREGSSTPSAAPMPPPRQEGSGPHSQEDHTGSHMKQGSRGRAPNSFQSSTLSLTGKIQVRDGA